MPAYLYSAVAHTDYTASIGENYTETETYTRDRPDGNTRHETRTVTRTEYRPLAGRHVSYVTDVIVSASAGLSTPSSARRAVRPQQMRRYSPALVSGWIAEEFSRARRRVRVAEPRARRSIRSAASCAGSCRATATAISRGETSVSWESMDPILVPVWVFAVRYREDKPPLRVVINGQTGKIAGKVPLSRWKIVLAIVALLAVIAARSSVTSRDATTSR